MPLLLIELGEVMGDIEIVGETGEGVNVGTLVKEVGLVKEVKLAEL